MATKKKGLGRGIGALIKEQGSVAEELIVSEKKIEKEIPISKIVPNPFQMRRVFNEEEIKSLADSIENEGLLQPILVRKKENQYEIIAGERRFRAFSLLGRQAIPANIVETEDKKMALLALIENVQREDLNPIETAEGYKSILDSEGMTQEILAKSIGKSRPVITNALRLLDLPVEVKDMLIRREISEGHARLLIPISSSSEQRALAEEVHKNSYSVRTLEQIIKGESVENRENLSKKNKEEHKEIKKDANVVKAEKDLEKLLGTKVTISDNNGKGKIVIDYYNSEDFERLFELFERKTV